MTKHKSVLGKKVQHAVDRLDTFKMTDQSLKRIEFVTHELASLCPVTNQPDISTCTIYYEPDEKFIESKSLKLFLWNFRDKGVFCEQLAILIASRVMQDAQPFHVHVEIKQQSRGGIITTAHAEQDKTL